MTRSTQEDLERLLERYYEGTTSPDEEMTLYLRLLKEKPGSPHYADRMLLETTLRMRESGSETCRETTTDKVDHPRPRVLHLLKYAAVAAILIIVGIGVFHISPDRNPAEASLLNGQPISQEQSDQYTIAALTQLSNCIQRCSEESTKITTIFAGMRETVRSSLEKVPGVSDRADSPSSE